MNFDELARREDVFVVITDHDGVITFANGVFREVFGWTPEQLVGQPITVLIPGRLHDAHNLGFSRFLSREVPTLLERPLALKLSTADGREVETEHFIMAEKREGKWIFGATIRPKYPIRKIP